MASNAKANETAAPAVTAEDEEWMDGAKAAFPSIENLAPSVPPAFGAGRLVAIYARENGVGKGDNGPYPYVETVTLVLDNGPDGNQSDDLVPAVTGDPIRLDLRHSTTGLVARLKPRVGTPKGNRPLVGRINTQASSRNKNVAAFSLAEPTEADMVEARKHKAYILKVNAEMDAAASKSEDEQAFG